MCVFSYSVVSDPFATSWSVASQPPLSTGFPRQEYWNGCHLLLQGVFLTQGWDLISCVSCIGRQGPYHSRQLGHPRVQYVLYQTVWFRYALTTFQHNWKTLTFAAWYSLGKQFWGYLKNLLSFFFLL